MKEKHPILYEFLQAVSHDDVYLSFIPITPPPLICSNFSSMRIFLCMFEKVTKIFKTISLIQKGEKQGFHFLPLLLLIYLSQEPVLRATQYLPDIVRLQQCLYDAFHHRLDKKEAVTQTVREFLENLISGKNM